jgi:TPR repeat protein
MKFGNFPSLILKPLARRIASLIAVILIAVVAYNPLLAKDRDVPRAEEGYANGQISDGKQNYPLELYGVSRDWDAQCRKGKADQCIRLAEAFEEGLGALKKDRRAALGYYLVACNKGSPDGCSTSASMLFDGDVGYRNDKLAFEKAQLGCESLSDQRSCAVMGYAYKRGMGVASDEGRAFTLWNTACVQGADLGCQFKAYALFNHNKDAESTRQAVSMFTSACDQQMAWGCTGLSFAHKLGRGLASDSAKAFRFAQDACVDGKGDTALACIQYGDLLLDSGQPQYTEKGASFLFTGCKGGSAYACTRLGETAVFGPQPGQKTTLKEGFHFLRAGCDLDDAKACEALGKAYLSGKGEIKAHPGITFVLWEKACKIGRQETCAALRQLGDATALRKTVPKINPSLPAAEQLALAMSYRKDRDINTAWFALVDLMHEGNDDAEWLVGSWMYYGEPGAFEANRIDGLMAIKNAASVGQNDAMKWLGYAYWDGSGVPQDRQLAKNYMGYLALQGDEEAIAVWRNMDAEGARQAYARRQAEFAALMERLAKIQATQRYARAASAASSYSSSSSSSYSGSSGPSLSDSLSRIRANNDYYAANVSRAQGRSCPTGNSYC